MFNMGYDLQPAGLDFAAVNKRNNYNLELLHGIADDFIKAARQKAGGTCDKEEIFYRFDESIPALNADEPVMILYVNAEANWPLNTLNRQIRYSITCSPKNWPKYKTGFQQQ